MPFDQTSISSVRVARDGTDLLIVWESSDPDALSHVYVDGRLTWIGTGTQATIPWPGDDVTIEVGTVGEGQALVDLSGFLPAGPPDRVTLTWTGGPYLDPDIQGFRVYANPAPGAPIDPANPVATVPAYIGPILDGFGVGGFGAGGFGRSASYYRWRSRHLAPGTWQFTVRPFDAAGNEGPAVMAYSATVAGPPKPPAADADGIRLRVIAYDPATRVATLGWGASA